MPVNERHRLHLSGATNENASDYNCLFHKKIRQYGIENFELIVLEQISNPAELDEREKYWIKEKQSYVKDGKGYNLTTGGQKRKNNEDYRDVRCALAKEQVQEIIQLLRTTKIPQTQIAKQYNVSETIINCINSGKKYRILPENEYPIRVYSLRKITEEEVQTIIALLQLGYGNAEIATMIGDDLAPTAVSNINQGYKHKQPNLSYPIRKSTNIQQMRKEKADRVKELLLTTNMNMQQIANEVQMDRAGVSRINSGKNYYDERMSYPIRK